MGDTISATTSDSALQADLHPPMSRRDAIVESERCFFCYDAPCLQACPTSIDIPLFIRQIRGDNPQGAAETIFSENILGGMCARVCPTETLCEQVCVRQESEGAPVRIGMLQRYATDHFMDSGEHPVQRAPDTDQRIAVVGAGPAGLSCAHRLASYGHHVDLYDARNKPGGLNEFGIASYKSPNNFAQREVDFVLGVGGIELKLGVRVGIDTALEALAKDYHAVFLAAGLGGVNALAIPGVELQGVRDAVEFIEELRQCCDYSQMHIGEKVAVVGGGMTAIDAAVQAKMLGAREVTVLYRSAQEKMKASPFEQELAQKHGVKLSFNVSPEKVLGENGAVQAVQLQRRSGAGSETEVLAIDTLLVAIGQRLDDGFSEQLSQQGLIVAAGKISVNPEGRCGESRFWAGGDCASGGDDLTVTAVQEGKCAAESIHAALSAQEV